jgi:XTP/dITP diphosphohydrolase
VHTARYAGDDATYADNVAKLLEDLATLRPEQRTARFATVAVARWPDGLEVAALGEVEGTIATSARGEGGFGYDPVFVPVEGDGRTFAEMSEHEKHALSHRARAFGTLAQGLRVIQETEGR